MSLKESLRRRQIRNHGLVRADVICSSAETIKRKESDIKLKETPKYFQDCVRRSALQQLDKADKSTVEARIDSTLKFYGKTLEIFINEYNSMQHKDEKTLSDLVYLYRIHRAKLNSFDAEIEFNDTTYTKNLGEMFVDEICKLNPLFIYILTPKTQSL